MDVTERYLSVLKKSLLNELYPETDLRMLYVSKEISAGRVPNLDDFWGIAKKYPKEFERIQKFKNEGWSWWFSKVNEEPIDFRNSCDFAHSMIGKKRMDHLHLCMDTVRKENLLGDFVETGICRGGAAIFMSGYIHAYNLDKKVWAADSFEGLPKPENENDKGFDLSKDVYPVLSVSLEDVKEIFERYDILDDTTEFLEGWFEDTLPNSKISKISILRMDGDLYSSTMTTLESLYDKVVPGGFVIVDDYNAMPPCKKAVHEFRSRLPDVSRLQKIDEASVFWRK